MTRKNKGKRKAVYSRYGVASTVWRVLVFYLIFFFIMALLDRYHAEFDAVVDRFWEPNHFSGATWFSLIASAVAAVPGIFCGILAIIQTKRIKELEDRYHRPNLGLQQAQMEVEKIRSMQYDCSTETTKKIRYVNFVKEESLTANILNFRLCLEIKNDIEVKKIVPEEITFKIAEKSYRIQIKDLSEEQNKFIIRSFRHILKNNKYLCEFEWNLFPYIWLEPAEGAEKEFWNAIEFFVNYDNWKRDDYQTIETEIKAKIYYEYAPEGFEFVTGRLSWNCENRQVPKAACVVMLTYDGYFTYDK